MRSALLADSNMSKASHAVRQYRTDQNRCGLVSGPQFASGSGGGPTAWAALPPQPPISAISLAPPRDCAGPEVTGSGSQHKGGLCRAGAVSENGWPSKLHSWEAG